jgi:hypothetical protein
MHHVVYEGTTKDISAPKAKPSCTKQDTNSTARVQAHIDESNAGKQALSRGWRERGPAEHSHMYKATKRSTNSKAKKLGTDSATAEQHRQKSRQV